MNKFLIGVGAVASAIAAAAALTPATAQEKLVVSTWGGNWKEGVEIIGKEFTKRTGVQVEYITGGTLDRLAKAKVARANPESDLVNTTAHVGYLYHSDGLMEKLDLSKIPNSADLYPAARRSDFTISDYFYVYAPAFRTDLMPKDFKIDSWNVLWSPAVKGKLGLPDFDPSHIIIAATKIAGVAPADWKKVEPKLLELKSSIKSFYQSDATSQNLMRTGETPVQVLLSSNGYFLMKQGLPVKIEIPKEGAVVGVDVWGINAGSKKKELALQFINLALDPDIQRQVCEFHKCAPTNTKTKLPPEVASLPGVFTSQEEIEKEAIILDDKTYATLLPQWKVWFTENMMH